MRVHYNPPSQPFPARGDAEVRRHAPDAQLRAEGPALPVTAHLGVDDLSRVLLGLPRTSLATGVKATIAHYRTAR